MPDWRLTVGLFGEFPNAQWEYPNATFERQQEIVADFKQRALGLLKFFTIDPAVPAEVRAKMATLGLCRDEYNRSEHWMSQLYVRTALRMVGRRVLTQQDVVRHETLPPSGLSDSIGVGAYVTLAAMGMLTGWLLYPTVASSQQSTLSVCMLQLHGGHPRTGSDDHRSDH
eukprot:COSAG02_NODE_2490_length_8694_cov_3.602909_11_plen_170_part_00